MHRAYCITIKYHCLYEARSSLFEILFDTKSRVEAHRKMRITRRKCCSLLAGPMRDNNSASDTIKNKPAAEMAPKHARMFLLISGERETVVRGPVAARK